VIEKTSQKKHTDNNVYITDWTKREWGLLGVSIVPEKRHTLSSGTGSSMLQRKISFLLNKTVWRQTPIQTDLSNG
jgi:hypothetical protein